MIILHTVIKKERSYMSNKQESIGLLKETNAGIQMGVSTLEEMISDIRDERLRAVMHDSKVEHDELGDEAHRLLLEYGADTKEPHLAAKAMSWMKTNVKMFTLIFDELHGIVDHFT